MTLFSNIRRKRHAAIKLGVIMFAWLIVFISPCALAFHPDGQPLETKGGSEIHEHSEHSHDESANPTLLDDCCCEHPDAITADSLNPFKSIALLALPMGQIRVKSLLLSGTQKSNCTLPVHITSPPVLLNTQRLRI